MYLIFLVFFVSGQLGDVKLEDFFGLEVFFRLGIKYSVQYSSNLEIKNSYNVDLNINEEFNIFSSKRLVKLCQAVSYSI